MPNLSIRGIQAATIAELKDRAQRENASVNSLVLKLIDQGLGRHPAKPARHHDLDALAGSWRDDEAAGFRRSTAQFEEVNLQLWK